MGMQVSAADSLSRWGESTDSIIRWRNQARHAPTVEEIWRMVQTQALAQDLVIDGPQGEMEYVD
jgi:hypothetical protein